jgi:hypothetical protein
VPGVNKTKIQEDALVISEGGVVMVDGTVKK